MTAYTDSKGHTYKIIQVCIADEEQREDTEVQILEQLYQIFTHRVDLK